MPVKNNINLMDSEGQLLIVLVSSFPETAVLGTFGSIS